MTPAGPAGGDASAAGPCATARHLRARRLQQVVVAALVAMAASGGAALALGRVATVVLIAGASGLLLAARALARRGEVETATATLLLTLTAMASCLGWMNRGAHDAAMLVYPGVLIFAGMLGTRRLLLLLLGIMLASIVGLVLVDAQGWRSAGPGGETYSTIVDLGCILVVTTYSVWLLTGDLGSALAALEQENERVRASQAALVRVESHDALTGLPNRVLARDRFETSLARGARQGRHCAALFLDLDHFKTLNDSLGHAAGDELLRQVATRLKDIVRTDDTVCRLGGDEFLVLLADLEDADEAAAVATKVLDAVAQPFRVQAVEVSTTASIGVAVCPHDGANFDEMLKNVDIAMYQAKGAGGQTFRFFDARMNACVIEHTGLLAGMRSGLARGEFQLHYQPQFDLRSGRLVGAEALLRWRHPTLGTVPPARFVPIAESSGFIVTLGAWAVREACRQAAAWHGRLEHGFRVSVNLSPVQFRRGDIESVLLNALDAAGLPPERLEVEITESMLVEDSRDLRGTLERLRAMGVAFAIDDFGTGYSNLAYLKRFEVGRLKIDQSFVRRLAQDAQDRAIVGAIVQMATRLGLTTIAEGVEDAPTLALLRALGCDEGQGFHWSAALPADAFATQWLAAALEAPAA
jgi:diguanylate cyclase